ncbi:MAG: hypothetical protein U0414_16965 [Polyangiaceae bacterium]
MSTRELVRLWEWGRHKTPVARALGMLRAAAPHADVDALAELSIGQRDGILLALRSQTIGASLDLESRCPSCGAGTEFNVPIAEILVAPLSVDPNRAIHALERDGVRVEFRLPNSRDLAATGDQGDREAARRILLDRCVVRATTDDASIPPAALPPAVSQAVAAAILELDTQAEIRFNLTCPDCQKRWVADLDIASFLWAEIDIRARRALREVHVLAQAYGWDEDRILALSSERRQYYISLGGSS